VSQAAAVRVIQSARQAPMLLHPLRLRMLKLPRQEVNSTCTLWSNTGWLPSLKSAASAIASSACFARSTERI
jgi:hypothetical protein